MQTRRASGKIPALMSAARQPPGAERWLRPLIDLRPGELGTLLLATAAFFLVLMSYFVLRPLRDEIGIARGVENLPWLWTGTLGVTLALTPVFGWIVTRYRRASILPIAFRFFGLNMLVFALLAKTLEGAAFEGMRYAFYFWLSSFNLFVIAMFWAFMADLWRQEQSRRVFGFVAVGGTLGAALGATLTKSAVAAVGVVGLLLISAALLELATQCIRRLAPRVPSEITNEATPERASVWRGLQLMTRNPFLAGVGLYVLLQTFVATFLELQVSSLVHDARAAGSERIAAFASRDQWTQLLTLVLQLAVTGRMLSWLGAGWTLVVQPALALTGFVLLAWALPSAAQPGSGFAAEAAALEFALVTAFVVQSVFRATQNAFARPARESLFTLVPRDEKYQAKTAIDTVVWRAGDVIFAFLRTRLPAALGLGAGGLALFVVPFAAGWIGLSWVLGRRHDAQARARDALNRT